ncbi:MAG: hypothetical protein GDA41_09350 [Rhodospirillales bacterium]|nr:hypothetical protein [Rhodospirillales bacterium]
MPLTRHASLVPNRSAPLFIDVQNRSAHREEAEFKDLSQAAFDEQYLWFFEQFEASAIPNMQALQTACQAAGVEVMQVTDACLGHTQERHDHNLRTIKGYCRQVTTAESIGEPAGTGG